MEIKVNVHICFSSKWELVILMTWGQAYGVVGHIVRRLWGQKGGRLGMGEEQRSKNQKNEGLHHLSLGLGRCLGYKMKKLDHIGGVHFCPSNLEASQRWPRGDGGRRDGTMTQVLLSLLSTYN